MSPKQKKETRILITIGDREIKTSIDIAPSHEPELKAFLQAANPKNAKDLTRALLEWLNLQADKPSPKERPPSASIVAMRHFPEVGDIIVYGGAEFVLDVTEQEPKLVRSPIPVPGEVQP